jgi:RNA recognition motif-containing protein
MNSKNINIYVGNLSLEMTEDELRKEFTVFGEVISVTIMDDKYIGSGQQRRYGYVEMVSKSEGETAITNLEGKRLRNLIVSVIKARPLSDKCETVTLNIRSNSRFSKVRERIYIET